MTTIDYDNFIRGQTILQSDTSDHSDALKLLKDKDGIVSYKKSQNRDRDCLFQKTKRTVPRLS